MAAIPDKALTSGLKNIEAANITATVKAVSPVLPPAATPAEDSINAVVGLVPKTARVVLMVLNVSGALFIGMAATALIAFFTGQLHFPKGFMSLPHLPEGLMISNPFTAFGDVIHEAT